MGHSYRAVGWNRQKRVYDLALIAGIVLYLATFVGVGFTLHPGATAETMLIRALGTGAFLLLHLVLAIGPLCRVDSRFLPLLYNRRHLGVATFVLGLLHGGFALVQFHALGDLNPLVSVFVSNPRVDSVAQFPFQPLGVIALVILFLMAATSHDFWLANLTAPVWKSLHMLVYLAYLLLVGHVSLGVLQAETSPVLAGAVGIGMAGLLALHLLAGASEVAVDRGRDAATGAAGSAAGHSSLGLSSLREEDSAFVDVCAVSEIDEKRARLVSVAGDRVAVFRYDGKFSAVSNACQHQNGPLGEGCVIDGLITCPWHGYQYRPLDGASPEPFTEKVPTFRVQIRSGRVLIDPTPLPAGTPVEPALIGEGASDG
ncbi:Rieske 2Fe-2S domain-containing protein [Engelhardtia mirabilis]|uniref:Naphthalene 1,2-dioxygenase system ferredoxin subunit n=1 Tax=Engelhardtia mirabilis TaxID=2528011 RepID=A0A518BEM0_9BACT|nr:Naphthalene 1,2-dioxygenase system ferredoxin subunit [Planctomycetes bacterium Pla133]QDU99757.1 Naphthalene 1,2-dioxygenase system ferredoxin subunit [Planctomycetes bacterium Pla86]